MTKEYILDSLPYIWPEVIGAVITKRDGIINLSPVNYQAVPTKHELPPVICVGMGNKSKMLEDVLHTKDFVYAYPSTGQLEDVLYCGTVSGHDGDKLARTSLEFEPSQSSSVPYLRDAVINYECRLVHHYDAGSFTIVVAEVQNAATGNKSGLDKIYTLAYRQFGSIKTVETKQIGRVSDKFEASH